MPQIKPKTLIPAESWETHIHVFDPQKFPYGLPRSYTPKEALLNEYPHTRTGCSRLLIVQATVQGHAADPLLSALKDDPRAAQCTMVRGLATLDSGQATDAELDSLHAAGVRGVRLHEVSWGHGNQSGAGAIGTKIKAAAARLARLGWVVDVFSDVRTWASLNELIRNEIDPRVRLVADHCGGAFPGDEKLPEFQVFLDLIRDGFLYVKLSGFERLYDGKKGGVDSMAPIVKAIIAVGKERILYGSDWPHTQLGVSRIGKTDEQRLNEIEGFRDVPDELHIEKLREWIDDDETWQNMWVNNPNRIFE